MDFAFMKQEDEFEDFGERACRTAAVLSGKTVAQADACEEGELACPNCPWRK